MASVTHLDSLDDPRLDVFARLTDHQLRARLEAERGVLVAETRLVVEVALDSGVAPLSFLVDERHLDACSDLLGRAGDDVPAFVLPHDQMERLTGYRVTRGLLCAMGRPAARPVGDVVAGARRVAVVEDLVDVTNGGALFRHPDACCAIERPAAEGEWPQGALELLRREGFACYAMALEPDAVPLDDPSLLTAEKRALLFGSEGYGLSRAALDACDRSVIIPMAHGVDSLNVAASSAVAFWQLFR